MKISVVFAERKAHGAWIGALQLMDRTNSRLKKLPVNPEIHKKTPLPGKLQWGLDIEPLQN